MNDDVLTGRPLGLHRIPIDLPAVLTDQNALFGQAFLDTDWTWPRTSLEPARKR